DLDGDGVDELVIASAIAGVVSILELTPARALEQLTSRTTGLGSSALAVTDLNGDGLRDVLVISSDDGALRWLLGAGAGELAAARSLETGAAPSRLAVGDVDGDGATDVAVIDEFERRVALARGDGHGGLSALVSLTARFPELSPRELVIADLDDDGVGEVVISDARVGLIALPVDSSAPLHQLSSRGRDIRDVTAADIDGDGVLELVTAGPAGLEALRAVADAPGVAVAAPFDAGLEDILTAADFDGDGQLDLIGRRDGGLAAALVVDGHAALQASLPSLPSTSGMASALYPARLNDDDAVDLLAVGDDDLPLARYSGRGDGSFGLSALSITVEPPRSLAVADLDGDGLDDIIAVGEAISSSGAPAAGPRLLLAPDKIAGWLPRDDVFEGVGGLPVVGELNGDGRRDVAFLVSDVQPPTLDVFYGTGDGSFARGPSTALPSLPLTRPRLADVDGDGRDELLACVGAVVDPGLSPVDPGLALVRVDEEGASLSHAPLADGALIDAWTVGGPRNAVCDWIAVDRRGGQPWILVSLREQRDDLSMSTSVASFTLDDGGAPVHVRSDLTLDGAAPLRGDFTGDGVDDLLSITDDGGALRAGLEVTALAPALRVPAEAPATTPATATLADAEPDAFTIAVADPKRAHVTLIRARGLRLEQSERRSLPCEPAAIAGGDLDGSGVDELVIACAGGDLLVLPEAARRGSSPVPRFISSPEPTLALAIADVDGDGALDVAALHEDNLELLAGRGTGQLETAARFASGYGGVDVAALEFNDAPGAELAIATRDEVTLVRVSPERVFTVERALEFSKPISHLAVGDIDRSGRDDLVIAGDFGVALHHDSDRSTISQLEGPSGDLALTLTDGDCDGDLDLYTATIGARTLRIHEGGADGFAKPRTRELTRPIGALAPLPLCVPRGALDLEGIAVIGDDTVALP
ncbi:MAG: VCBS repeat-containing protein, partial [Myxococcales bacterium]|nr:VCBS repeat-containing protein [Myxococcales bacterium]